MIAGLEPISGGDVRIAGQRVNDLPPRSRDIAMVFQDYALYPHKTLYENMAFGLRLRKTPEAEIQRRVMDAARLLRIDHMLERRPAALSGGQRQRVAIGRAIVREPKVFLFDEPLSNLDAQLRNEMRSEIKRLHQRLGATIIYVTHDQVEAMTLADRIAVLSGGHKMQYDTPDAVYNRPAALFVAGFTGAPPMNLADCTLAGGRADLGGAPDRVPADLADRARHAGTLTFGVRPENITLAPTTADASACPPGGAAGTAGRRDAGHAEDRPGRDGRPRAGVVPRQAGHRAGRVPEPAAPAPVRRRIRRCPLRRPPS
jgi:multiple sugar transport system ATP-binding protein